MTYYYPQWCMTLRIRFEDFKREGDAADPRFNKETVITVVPKNLNVNINDYTKADTFTCDLDYKSFPFDPRTIRSLGVTIHAEDMQGLEESEGLRKQIEPKETRNGIVGNEVFIGFADTDTIKFDEDNRVVSFEGRDLTALFIDTAYNDPSPLPLNLVLEDLIGQLVTRLPATKNIKVVNLVEVPPLAKFFPDINELAGNMNKRSDSSYWDLFQQIANKAAVIMYMQLDTLIITRPQVLYDKKKSKQFIWGKNVKTLEFKRKLGRLRDFNIVVRSLNPGSRTTPVLEAKIPLEASQAFVTRTGIPKKEVEIVQQAFGKEPEKKVADYLSFRIPDIANKEHLVTRAEQIYEELGRQQLEGTLSTLDMVVPEGEKSPFVEFDVLKMKVATPIEIRMGQEDLESIKRTATVAERINYLLQHGYDQQVAELFAKTLGAFSTTFYTKQIEFAFNQDTGFKMSLDFLNFIELSESLFGGINAR